MNLKKASKRKVKEVLPLNLNRQLRKSEKGKENVILKLRKEIREEGK